jgi:hypothetical protein
LWGAVGGALLGAFGLAVLLFLAIGLSAGAFLLLLDATFGYFFGEHAIIALIGLGALAGAVAGVRRAASRWNG